MRTASVPLKVSSEAMIGLRGQAFQEFYWLLPRCAHACLFGRVQPMKNAAGAGGHMTLEHIRRPRGTSSAGRDRSKRGGDEGLTLRAHCSEHFMVGTPSWDEAMLLRRRVSKENKSRGEKPPENDFFWGMFPVVKCRKQHSS